ncbi:triggering receptor expressed on myeloid cells 1-like [Peromyscus eremicus]|uniref:triggering receptor expressed on myeloid cells 1-like n=1 Tax=Peromyscus eremicus TaxID=42410 RepID=UPI0027DCD8A3|nr:triggering receptor expressed on myeloid cells 1-like [Peromyscus eremicus]
MAWEATCLLSPILLVLLASGAQRSKFSIRDYPDSQFFNVTMTALTVRDSGLYICGIAENLKRISILRNIHLEVSKDSSGLPTLSITPTTIPTKAPILITTKHVPRDRTVTQPFPKFTAGVSSPDPGVTFPNVTTVTRVSISSVVVPVVCGLFVKTLVFTVLFAVTQRSFG